MIQSDIELFNSILSEILNAEKENPVVTPEDANTLVAKLELALRDDPISREELKDNLVDIVRHTPKTASIKFYNQLFGGRNSIATVGELLSAVLNNSMYTYKVGGPMILVEKEMVLSICALAGYGAAAYGTMAPGGSMTNFMGMLMARDNRNPDIRSEGVSNKMVMYASAECHYSIKKNASFMGVGAANIRYIKADKKGAMNVELLEKQIIDDRNNGYDPFLVIGTAGTTVMGAIDPIEAISDITRKYGLWFHLDAAFYGPLLFSEKYKKLLKGIERTNSFSMNMHKLLSTPLSCSFIFTKEKKHLYDSFNSDADYLFQEDEDDMNPGKISLLCGRRNDALKFWVQWKLLGTRQLGKIVEHEFELADFASNYVRENQDYTLYSFDDSMTVCFNYKDISPVKLCQKLNEEGELMVGYGKFNEDVFVRFVLVNSQNTKSDILNFFKTLESFAERHF